MEIPFEVIVDNKKIVGIMHMPEKLEEIKLIMLMVYGFNGERVDNNRISVLCGREAAKCGFCFVRFDYRGLGVSEGEFWETSLITKVQDVLAVIKYIESFLERETDFILLGFSDGARVVSRIVEVSPKIKGICLWSPVLNPIVDNVHGNIPRKFFREPMTGSLVSPHRGLWVGYQYMKEQSEEDNTREIELFQGKILSIFGGGDPVVKETKDALTRISSTAEKDIEIAMIPEADHLYSQYAWVIQVISKTVKWGLTLL